jgi:hypothetical protein
MTCTGQLEPFAAQLIVVNSSSLAQIIFQKIFGLRISKSAIKWQELTKTNLKRCKIHG